MPDYKFKDGNPADEAKLRALAESNNITLEKLMELNGITVSEEETPKKQKDGVKGANAPSENQAPDMASLLESGFEDLAGATFCFTTSRQTSQTAAMANNTMTAI